jgi:hypothetical protein
MKTAYSVSLDGLPRDQVVAAVADWIRSRQSIQIAASEQERQRQSNEYEARRFVHDLKEELGIKGLI